MTKNIESDERKKRNLILHVGGAKCGSSAIQHSLVLNHGVLLSRGVLIPDERLQTGPVTKGEQIFLFRHLLSREDAAQVVRERFLRLAAHMEGRNLHTCIVSAENLINESKYAEICSSAKEFFEPIVVLYVRRQDEWVISAWQQWFLKQYATVEDFLRAPASRYADWLRLLAPWEEHFGVEAIKIRPFKKSLLYKSDVVQDFWRTLGISTEKFEFADAERNKSFNETIGDLANRNRKLFSSNDDNRFFECYVRLLGGEAFKTEQGSSVLTHAQRLEIWSEYEKSNNTLAERYLENDVASALFARPDPSESIVFSDIDRIRRENALLAAAVFRLSMQLEKLRQDAGSR